MDLAKTTPIIGIDHMDRSSDAVRYLARLGNPYGAVGTDTDGKVLADFGFDSIPTTLILNGDGNVLYVHRGRLRESDIDGAMRPLLSKVAP
jgi:cytochrome c biogenesis protein CcmG/thiol:disulfide interchange protein DsbE